MELYRKYRPRQFKEVVGQDHITRPLLHLLKKGNLPHAIMFTGPSGCGKTTLARILKTKLKCSNMDFKDINAAKARGIDEIRDMDRGIHGHPIGGDCRIWLFDEGHKLTNDAQNALLKVLEDAPDHVYVFLCTTSPNKVIATVRNRCTPFAVKLLGEDVLIKMMQGVISQEGTTLDPKVAAHIAKHCGGSGRVAMVMLEKALSAGKDIKSQMDAVLESQTEQEAFSLVKMLIWEQADFSKIAKFLQTFKENGTDVESIRHLILACAATETLKNGRFKERAYNVINAFRDPYYDCGFPGLVASCFEVAVPSK